MGKREIDKSETRTVSLPLSMWEAVERRAEEHYGGKRSSYIRALVSNDMGERESSSHSDPEIIVSLIKHFRPAVANEIARFLENEDQQLLMDQIIDQLVDVWRGMKTEKSKDVVVVPRQLFFKIVSDSDLDPTSKLLMSIENVNKSKISVGNLLENTDLDM